MTDSQFVIDLAALLSVSKRDSSSLFLSLLAIPSYVAIASAVSLILTYMLTTRSRPPDIPAASNEPKGRISVLGGPVIFGFMLMRSLICLALLVLTAVSPYQPSQKWIHVALLSTSVYSTLLASASLLTSLSWSRNIVRHLTTVLIVTFAVYAYRDLYPLATFTLSPQDEAEGRILWAKISLLFLAGIVIPLTVPKPYIPADPEFIKPPTPEQSASWLSSVLYGFMDPVVWKAYRSVSLAYEDLPLLADSDHAEVLKKKGFPHADPAVKHKRRNLFFSLMRVFRADFLQSSFVLIILAVTDLASPIGVRQLLGYLETQGADAVMKPWFWVAWLFFLPTVNTLASERYMYIGTRVIVRAEALLTELIFEHALRIRIKAETSEKEKTSDQSPATPATPAPETSSPPANTSEQASTSETSDDDDDSKTARSSTATAAETHSRETTLQADSSEASSSRRTSSANLKKEPGEPSTSSTPAAPAEKTKADAKNLTGKLNNLVTTDMQNIVDGREFIRLLVHTPVQVGCSVAFLYVVLGWSAFVGLAMIVILFPLPGLLAKLVQKAQQARMKKTDARVQTVTETMGVLRMVKMFGWEGMMKERISEKREDELKYVKRLRLLDLSSMMIKYQHHSIHDYASYILHITLIMKQSLTASKVFSSMVVFSTFSMQLQRAIWILNQSAIAKTSLDRVTEFLYDTELLDAYSEKDNEALSLQVAPSHSKEEIGFHNATFSWSSDYSKGTATPSTRRFLLMIDDLKFKRGCINLILGPTGSGKTSVLMALLSEMHFMPPAPDSWYNLPRDGGVAYAAQESWVQNATIKDNIVFGAEFDEERYKKVIYQCALERDLSLFQAGDETEVGEKGLTLSGGQKARVTLARAVYSQAEIILLDDVLAALDVHTSKWIVEKCFKGDLLKGRTVILVTHNVVMVRPIAGFVVSMKDGRILSKGTVSDALSKDKALAAEIKMEEEMIEHEEEAVDDAPAVESKKSDGKLIVAEEVQLGRVGWPAFKLFLDGLGGNHVVLFFLFYIISMILSEGFSIIQVWFLGYWARQYEQRDPSEVNVLRYVGLYAGILFTDLGCFSIGFVIYLFGVLRLARSIHKELVEAVLGTTLRWLDTTPTSRVITRCTQDMREIDGMLPQLFNFLVRLTLTMVGEFYSVIFFTPAFLGPGVLFAVVGGICGTIYLKAQLPIKRVQSNAKAPVLAHFGTAITGIVSIRAYGVQDGFIKESLERINYYSRPSRVFWNLNRWVDVRLDVLGNVFSSSLAAYLVYIGHGDASNTGFSLNMAVAFSSGILHYIRIFNMFEIRANSLERIHGYITIEQEPKPTKEGVPPAYWPSSGELKVENLNARYSLDGPKVLTDVSFHVKSGERIGVVGRTGSGKSSLMLSLLRCIYTEGEVYYDGLPTASVNLDDLRSNMTIIPQMPELLSGTVRRNLDPFDQFDDAALYDALRSAGLYSVQSEDEDNRIDLDTTIASGGGNLSVGQRQILALARAMVRGSKLLILDEATSAIDYKTDAVIQSSLRNELKGDVTLITVAHRLQTIMDADRIMVLDAGKIVEYDSPKELLKNQDGHLRALVDESSDKERLYEMAEHHHNVPVA